MWWGKGDTSKLDEDQKRTLDNLRRLAETGHIVTLDHDDAMIAIEALDWYRQWTSVGKLMRSVRNIGLLVAGLLGMWWATQGAIADWILKVAQG